MKKENRKNREEKKIQRIKIQGDNQMKRKAWMRGRESSNGKTTGFTGEHHWHGNFVDINHDALREDYLHLVAGNKSRRKQKKMKREKQMRL